MNPAVKIEIRDYAHAQSDRKLININNFCIHYYKNVFAHKCYYYAYDSNATSTFTFSASVFRVYKCSCVIKFHVAGLINEYTYEYT